MVTEYLFPRHVNEVEFVEVSFDNKTLKELRDTIDKHIQDYGENAYVKETCQPHDNYSFSIFVKQVEPEEEWKARWEKEIQRKKKLLEDKIAKDQAELKALENGAPR